jgi:hypothetical protein
VARVMRVKEAPVPRRSPLPSPRRRAPAPAGPEERILALQRSAGNAAVGRVLQRDWYDYLPSPLNPLGPLGELTGIRFPGIGSVTDPLAVPFEAAMQSNRAMADRITVPDKYREKLYQYAQEAPLDGFWLVKALLRSPRFYKGGWILDVQTGAKAMTLDNYVFVKGDLDIGTYIHELVHVTQYAFLGRTKFLMSYFGLSAVTIAKRFIMQEDLDMMDSSPHEMQAYELEKRFLAWFEKNK